MNVCVEVGNINKRNVYLYDYTANKVIDNSTFVRTGYSNSLFTLNSIYLYTNFVIACVNKYFRKHRYIIEHSSNSVMIDKLIDIENMILNTIDRPELLKTYKLKEQLLSSNIIVFDGSELQCVVPQLKIQGFILKISGIWITDNSCGITFKFFSHSSVC